MTTTIYQIIDDILYSNLHSDFYRLKINKIEEPNELEYGYIEILIKIDEFPSREVIREIENAFEDYMIEVDYERYSI